MSVYFANGCFSFTISPTHDPITNAQEYSYPNHIGAYCLSRDEFYWRALLWGVSRPGGRKSPHSSVNLIRKSMNDAGALETRALYSPVYGLARINIHITPGGRES